MRGLTGVARVAHEPPRLDPPLGQLLLAAEADPWTLLLPHSALRCRRGWGGSWAS